jgi:hypothetical protein
MGVGHEALIRRAPLAGGASSRLAMMVSERVLPRMGSFVVRSGTDRLCARGMSAAALARRCLAPRRLPLSLEGPLRVPLAHVPGLRVDRGDTRKAGEGHQGESRAGPAVQSRHMSLQIQRA